MPQYKCTYINSSGQKGKTSIEAMSEDVAILRLRSAGFYVISIQREESQKQSPKPEPQQNFVSWAQKNNSISYQSSFKFVLEKPEFVRCNHRPD